MISSAAPSDSIATGAAAGSGAGAGDANAGRPVVSMKRTRKPGCSSAGTSRPRSHIGLAVTPMICQPPGLACG